MLAVEAWLIPLNMITAGLNRLAAVSKKGLHEKDLKLAMSLKGRRGRKYKCRMIRREHFLAIAKEVGFDQDSMNEILDDMAERTERVIQYVSENLPVSFPSFFAEPIFDGMRRYSQRL